MPDYVEVIINSVVSFVIMFIIAKVLGKKQIAELSFIDYVLGISIGSIVAEWTTDVETPWYLYLIALVIYFVFSLSITLLERTTLFCKAFFRGRPLIIIEQGRINFKNLKKSKLDVNDVIGLCREKGFFSLKDVEYAIFETDGNLSVLPTAEMTPLACKDFDKVPKTPTLEKFVITDGQVDKNYLKTINKNQQWLFERLNIKTKKQLDNIILAFYDEKTDTFDVHYKS